MTSCSGETFILADGCLEVLLRIGMLVTKRQLIRLLLLVSSFWARFTKRPDGSRFLLHERNGICEYSQTQPGVLIQIFACFFFFT